MSRVGEDDAGMEGQISEPQCSSQLDLESQSKGTPLEGSNDRSEETLPLQQASEEEGANVPNNGEKEHVDASGKTSGIEPSSEDLKVAPPLDLGQSEDDKPQQQHAAADSNSLQQLPDEVRPTPVSVEEPLAAPQDSITIKQETSQHYEGLNQAPLHTGNQQTSSVDSPDKATRKPKITPTIPFQSLIPILQAHLDKDRDMQLQNMWAKLRKNEVTKEEFLKIVRNIVGDQTLRQAAQKVHSQIQTQGQKTSQSDQSPSQPHSLQSQPFQQQLSSGVAMTNNDLQRTRPYPVSSSDVLKGQVLHQTQSYPVAGRPNLIEAKGMHPVSSNINPVSSMQLGMPQQNSQFSQSSSPMYGNSNNPHLFPRATNPTSAPFRAQTPDTQARATPQSLAAQPPAGSIAQNIPAPNHLASQHSTISWQMPANKELRPAFPPIARNKQEPGDPHADLSNKSLTMRQENNVFAHIPTKQLNPTLGSSENEHHPLRGSASLSSVGAQTQILISQGMPAESSVQVIPAQHALPAATTTKTPQKKPFAGQKKPLEAGSASQHPSKKQKTSGADQTIEQLNDVTAVSGVDLREEEEQLFSAKDEGRISEAARRVVQEEEERLILLRGPLQKKLLEIAAKCNLKSINSEVERCLSMCVEERLRSVICSLIRHSKQRMDAEKSGHRFVITSDVRRQILHMNRKAKEEWDKKQAEEAEKNKKTNEGDPTSGADAEKDKDETRSKTVRVNREEDDKMRTTAANVAARAAVGGADLLSRWQLMAEKRKRVGSDSPSGSQPGKAAASRPSQGVDRGGRAPQTAEKKGQMSGGGMRRPGRFSATPAAAARRISMKDVISVLERETQMAKSPLVYRLYERASRDTSTPAE